MQTITITKILSASLLVTASAVNAFAADGVLGSSSTGKIFITMEIGAAELNQLSPTVASELQSTNNTSFPICVTYIDSQFVSVSVHDLEQDGFNLIGADGQPIPYQISLGGVDAAVGEGAKVKAINNAACSEESALEVNVSLLPSAEQGEFASVNGKINFLIKSE